MSAGATPQAPPSVDSQLAEEIEAAYFVVPELPGRLVPLGIPGVRGWKTDLDHHAANLVGWAGANGPVANAVSGVCELFERHRAGFTWLVGPTGRRDGVAGHLAEHGLERTDEMVMMVHEDLESDSGTESRGDAVTVWELDDPSDPVAGDLMGAAFRVPSAVGRLYHDAYMTRPEHHRSRLFAAAADATTPAAVGYLSYLPGSNAVLMRAAATLEEARGAGLYRALLRYRLAEASAAGARRAFVHAGRRTSATACAKAGFREVATLDVYVRRAPGDDPSRPRGRRDA